MHFGTSTPRHNKDHAELWLEPDNFHTLMETLNTPREADRAARIQARHAEANSRRVNFFTQLRGENA